MTLAPSRRTSQSPSLKLPVRSIWESTLASMANSLFTSCSLLISRLNSATHLFFRSAMYSAIFSTKAVLPIEGLAAIRIRSEGWKPDVL